MGKRETISDVAQAAHVSATTVSRYLNQNYQKMSDATKARIARVISELNYSPSSSARQLRQKDSKLVGVLVGDIANPFSSLMTKGIYDVLQPAGYDIQLMNSNDSNESESRHLDRLIEQRADGIIAQPSAASFSQFERCRVNGIPIIIVDRTMKDLPADVGYVTSENYDACYRLGQVLVDYGYQNVISVSSRLAEASGQILRIKGLMQTTHDHQLQYVNLEMRDGNVAWLEKELQDNLQELSGRTVIVSLMGPLLFNLLDILKHLNLTFPDDLGLISFDDWDWSRFVGNGIFLLRQDMELMGSRAAQLLLDAIHDPQKELGTEYLPVTTVERPSIMTTRFTGGHDCPPA